MKLLPPSINESYELVKEQKLPYRRFKHKTILELLDKLDSSFIVEQIGSSIEGRPIKSVTIGRGAKRILMWTQMHGNEPTATRAVFDFLNFLQSDFCDESLKNLLGEITLKIIPVLNPDGLERYQRRNAIGIDPNRDASRKETPEMQVLFQTIEKFKPNWCFNMHDQRNLFNVSGSGEPACLSFLSPSTADGKRSSNQIDAMMMIDKLHHYLNDHIEGKMGRFTHEFYPTASGDNIQSMGYRTILVESGGYRNDVEREVPRKMNFLLLWEAIRLVATKEWERGTNLRYAEIPQNDQKLFDLLIRNVTIASNGHRIQSDVGIDRQEVSATNKAGFVNRSIIRDMGDLSHYWGYEEIDAKGYVIEESLKLNQLATFTMSSKRGDIKLDNGFKI